MRKFGIYFLGVGLISLSAQAVPQVTKVPVSLKNLVSAINECGGNGSGRFGLYDVESFDPAEALEELKARTEKEGCEGDHSFSRSQEDALKRFRHSMKNVNLIAGCLEDRVSKAHRREMYARVTNPANLAVFAIEPVKNMKNSESCLIYRYRTYLPNGAWIEFEFNFTD
jgi:hypothetical protein